MTAGILWRFCLWGIGAVLLSLSTQGQIKLYNLPFHFLGNFPRSQHCRPTFDSIVRSKLFVTAAGLVWLCPPPFSPVPHSWSAVPASHRWSVRCLMPQTLRDSLPERVCFNVVRSRILLCVGLSDFDSACTWPDSAVLSLWTQSPSVPDYETAWSFAGLLQK